MLAYILAIAVGLASLSLYLSAFFLPELHRKDDFLWSGVGLFYALVLWVCAGRVTGGVLLGQSAAVTLVICFGWQTLRLRRAIAHPDEKTDIQGFSLLKWVQNRFKKKSTSPTPPVSETPKEEQPTPETETEETPVISQVETPEESEVTPEPESEITLEETLVISQVEPSEESDVIAEPESEITSEEKEVTPEPKTKTETTENKKQGFSFKSLFGLGKSKSQPTTQPPEKITSDADLEESNWDDDDDEKDGSDIEEVTPSLVEETEDNQSEPVAETSNTNEEESTEQETTEQTETLEEYVAEFEPYMADDDAETVIEDYQPKSESSESETTDKDEEEKVKTEDSSSQVIDEKNEEIGENEQQKN